MVPAGIHAELVRLSADNARQHIPESLLIKWRACKPRSMRHLPALLFGESFGRNARHDLLNGIDQYLSRCLAKFLEGQAIGYLGGALREIAEPQIDAPKIRKILRLIHGKV